MLTTKKNETDFSVEDFETWYGPEGNEITTAQEASQAALSYGVESVQVLYKSTGRESWWRVQFGSGWPSIGNELGPTVLSALKHYFRVS
jgi:hypothetical protein